MNFKSVARKTQWELRPPRLLAAHAGFRLEPVEDGHAGGDAVFADKSCFCAAIKRFFSFRACLVKGRLRGVQRLFTSVQLNNLGVGCFVFGFCVSKSLRGGMLTLAWDGTEHRPVLMTGPATTVFEGRFEWAN